MKYYLMAKMHNNAVVMSGPYDTMTAADSDEKHVRDRINEVADAPVNVRLTPISFGHMDQCLDMVKPFFVGRSGYKSQRPTMLPIKSSYTLADVVLGLVEGAA